VSGSGRQGGGLEAQRRAIAAVCRRQGWRLVAAVEETGFSVEDRERPGIQAALRQLETTDGNGLVAANKGRLSRLISDLNTLITTAHTHGWALLALDCNLDTTTTEAGEPEATLLASFAPFERSLHSKRIRQALAAKRAQGIRLGRPPTMSNYAIDRIKREHAAGKSLTQIANGLNSDHIPTAQGGQAWHPATIRHTLNRTH
jgi:DNA invertase Pin-like site-specific DNA recombinase